ncbi:uncharacterized protein BX664DRAFT_268258, partial [Halteromyces radiatus]|uniref:uncharacterized protein n=1 Tax=Halteromyces radiatus TaxID=101107 RepID=UPI0022210121
LSSEHVIRITKLRSALEHCLVSQFSATTISRKDFYNDAQVWKELNAMLYSWSQWLADDDRTCQIELRSQQLAQQILEKEFMETLQHIDDIQVKSNLSTTKSGYLLFKSTESSIWERQWFFAHNGYFGFCKVNEFDTGATVTLELCIPLSFCQVNSLDDTDRHFQLMTKQTSSKVYLILQAETEQEKQDWITILLQKGTIASSSSSSSSSSNTTTKNLRSTLSGSHSTTTTYSSNSSKQRGIIPSIKLLSTSKNELHLSNAPSMTPLLLFSISNQLLQNDVSTTQSKPYDILSGNSKMWGNPQSIIPRGITLDWTHKQLDVTRASDTYQSIQRKTIWPPSPMITQLCIPDLPGYTTYLSNKNNELRNLFFGVSSDEVVLDGKEYKKKKKKKKESIMSQDDLIFSGSLHKKHHSSSATNLNDHQKLSDFGYCYNGSGYMTQHTFWFYSNISANCINTVALKWKDVEDIQVIENSRLMIHVTGSTDATNQDFTTPLVFSTRLDDIDTLVEKLRFFVYSAKLANPMQLRNMYRKILNISSTSSSLSYSPTQQSMTEMSASESSSACISPTPPVLSDRMASSETTATLDTTTTLVSSDENGSRTATPIIHKKPAKKTKKKNITQSFEIQQPSGPVSCDCDDHLDRRDAELVLPISAKRLFELMFSDESTAPPSNGGVWNAKTEGIEGHDLRVSHWESLSTDEPQQGLMKRTLKYWMPVANPVVRMKEAEVVETQILLKKQDYICYVVQISTKTEALPFADAFVPSVRYCITYVDDSQCKLSCHLGVKWLKWVMAKLIVTKAALAGMSDSVGVFVPILKEAAATIQSTVEETRQLRQASSNDVEVSEYEDEEEDNDDGGRWDTKQMCGAKNGQLVSHAIYLRDLDEGFLQKSLQPPYAGSQSYELFIQTKRDERQHVWYDGQHYRLAMEYGNSRAQLGVLRHDVISMFQALNMADSYLLENEYLNWLLDYRQRCRGEKDLMNDQALEFNDTMICDQVKIHIGTYF